MSEKSPLGENITTATLENQPVLEKVLRYAEAVIMDRPNRQDNSVAVSSKPEELEVGDVSDHPNGVVGHLPVGHRGDRH